MKTTKRYSEMCVCVSDKSSFAVVVHGIVWAFYCSSLYFSYVMDHNKSHTHSGIKSNLSQPRKKYIK